MRALIAAGIGVVALLGGLWWAFPPLALIVGGAGLTAAALLHDNGEPE